MRILVINPGSTSTKIAIYEDETPVLECTIRHAVETLNSFVNIVDQLPYRRDLILQQLEQSGEPLAFDAVVGRGGLVKPLQGGVYRINSKMLYDTKHAKRNHPCNLGCPIAVELGEKLNIPLALTADPVVVDELIDEARVSGLPEMPRHSIWHALNQKATSRHYAKEHGKRYEDVNLIVCHLGGGISVAAHRKGRTIDVNNALDGDGPFAADRAGMLPTRSLVEMCFSGKYTSEEVITKLSRHGGLMAHLGTNDVREITKLVFGGDKHAKKIVDALIFQVSKAICAEAAALCGPPEAILLTGGAANSEYLIEHITQRVGFLAPIVVYPGENEMLSLAQNALEVLRGERVAQEY